MYLDFDKFDYLQQPQLKIDPQSIEPILLKTGECEAFSDLNGADYNTYVTCMLELSDDIPSSSLLLFEVFGIRNPSSSQSIEIFLIQKF